LAKSALSVVRAFGAVSWQGLPLHGFRRFGVPPGGAWDQESFALANVLVGNEPQLPVIEVLGGSVELRAEVDCVIGVVGAAAAGSRRFAIGAGMTFTESLGATGHAFYVAVRAGDIRKDARLAHGPRSLIADELRFVAGPQARLVGSNLRTRTVSNLVSRAGVRLSAGASHAVELPSEPACVGAIQVTPDGTPIILGPDGPTIGGYPKVAVVCGADLNKVAHLRPGSEVRFIEVSREDAHYLAVQEEERVVRTLAELSVSV
jgi:allophanate hydrolase subunit 2